MRPYSALGFFRFRSSLFLMVPGVVPLALASTAAAQCDQWLPGNALPGFNGGVTAMMPWDPDGPGPRPEGLVIAGGFTMVQGVAAQNIVFWDGVHWYPFGPGLNNIVGPVTVYRGQLVAGGSFTASGNTPLPRVATWDGQAWRALGSGLNGDVYALHVFGQHLIAAGRFRPVNGVGPDHVASWDGFTWAPIGEAGWDMRPWGVFALGDYNGELIAGGDFSGAAGTPVRCLARWTGTAWLPFGEGLAPDTRAVRAIIKYRDDLIVAGDVYLPRLRWYYRCIAAWDGTTWREITGDFSSIGEVAGLVPYGEDLIAIGTFNRAGMPTESVGRYDGSEWRPVGDGLDVPQPVSAFLYPLPRTVFNDRLIVSQRRPTLGSWSDTLVQLEENRWRPVFDGFDAPISCFTRFNNRIVAAGEFWTVPGRTRARLVSAWDGLEWRGFGDGLIAAPYTVVEYGGELIAGGARYPHETYSSGFLQRSDGNRWETLIGNFDRPVRALLVDGDELIVAGDFTLIDAHSAAPIIAWNGNTWRLLGSLGFRNGTIRGLALWNGQLIAAGAFAGNFVSRWDGTAWQSMSYGLAGRAEAICVFNDQLIAAVPLPSGVWLARSDGASWQPVGGGVNGVVRTLAVVDGRLVVGGDFSMAGDRPIQRLAAWDGVRWSGFDGGVDRDVRAIAAYDGELFVGGGFERTGGQNSAYLARWAAPCPTGDPNCDGLIDLTDIEPFILALTDPAAYESRFPTCGLRTADINQDGDVNNLDIDPFIALLNGR